MASRISGCRSPIGDDPEGAAVDRDAFAVTGARNVRLLAIRPNGVRRGRGLRDGYQIVVSTRTCGDRNHRRSGAVDPVPSSRALYESV